MEYFICAPRLSIIFTILTFQCQYMSIEHLTWTCLIRILHCVYQNLLFDCKSFKKFLTVDILTYVAKFVDILTVDILTGYRFNDLITNNPRYNFVKIRQIWHILSFDVQQTMRWNSFLPYSIIIVLLERSSHKWVRG